MQELHNAAIFAACITTGLVHQVPWKVVIGPLALVVAGVVMGTRRVSKRK